MAATPWCCTRTTARGVESLPFCIGRAQLFSPHRATEALPALHARSVARALSFDDSSTDLIEAETHAFDRSTLRATNGGQMKCVALLAAAPTDLFDERDSRFCNHAAGSAVIGPPGSKSEEARAAFSGRVRSPRRRLLGAVALQLAAPSVPEPRFDERRPHKTNR